MPSLITLRHGYIEIILILLHLSCLVNFICPPKSEFFSPEASTLEHISDSIQLFFRHYIPHIYPPIFELLSLPYTGESGKNMKFITFKHPDVFSIAYATVAPITIRHIFSLWLYVLRIWWKLEAFDPANGLFPITNHFNSSILAWMGALCITIYSTIPAYLLMFNITGNILESLLEMLLRYLDLGGREKEWDKWYWFRLKWGRTWATNIFWWWENNPILLIQRFKNEVILFGLRPRYLDRRPTVLPLSTDCKRSKTMHVSDGGRENMALKRSWGFNNSCVDLREFGGGMSERPVVQHRRSELDCCSDELGGNSEEQFKELRKTSV